LIYKEHKIRLRQLCEKMCLTWNWNLELRLEFQVMLYPFEHKRESPFPFDFFMVSELGTAPDFSVHKKPFLEAESNGI